MITWLAHFFGLDNGAGAPYLWWSGAGSDISEVVLIGAVIAAVRHHNCHVKGCIRLGKHPVEGTPYKVCRRHHPAIPGRITAEHVADAYRDATG